MTLKSKSYIVNVGDDKEIFQKIKIFFTVGSLIARCGKICLNN
jgi:hypothetical protein